MKAHATNTAPGICHAAGDLVGGDRAKTHGDMLEGAEHLAALWTAYLNGRAAITALDVPNMLIHLKQIRVLHGSYNPDDFIDISGYGGYAGEVAARVEAWR